MNFLPTNTVLLDDQRYKVEITLINSSGELPIPNGVVQSLIIEDNLYSIFFSARLIINSSENMLESFVTGSQNELKEEYNTSYIYNVDNRDHIQIDIVPVSTQGEDDSTYPPDVYRMDYLFSVYDEEEILSSGGTQKIKIL